MVRPEWTERAETFNEDWYEEAQNTSSMTANTPTTIISKSVDKNSIYLLQSIGTNGDYNIKLEIKNKNDLIGDYVRGNIAPIYPNTERYWLAVKQIFEEGDELKIVATAASATGTTHTKFDVRGKKNEHMGARAVTAPAVAPRAY